VPGAIQLVNGDMFDGPCDLIVIPCATGGAVTSFVRERLRQFKLPVVPPRMALGDVRLFPFAGADQVAQFVAYAASVPQVHHQQSSPETIRHIGQELGRATQSESIQTIHCPLLGTGAGHLPSATVVDELSAGFNEDAEAGSVLKIFVLDGTVYEELVRRSVEHRPDRVPSDQPLLSADEQRLTVGRVPPRVLISYTGSSPTNQQWVDELFRYLRANGVNARLDTYFLRPGMDIVQWMCNELDLADRVILVCDEQYAARADRRHGGVGWETMLVQGDMYADMYRDLPEDAPPKYIPVVRSVVREAGLPVYLRTKLALHFPPGKPEDEARHRLLNEIRQTGPVIPPVAGFE
jgi:TIR domain